MRRGGHSQWGVPIFILCIHATWNTPRNKGFHLIQVPITSRHKYVGLYYLRQGRLQLLHCCGGLSRIVTRHNVSFVWWIFEVLMKGGFFVLLALHIFISEWRPCMPLIPVRRLA
jgi:hypothetical protein